MTPWRVAIVSVRGRQNVNASPSHVLEFIQGQKSGLVKHLEKVLGIIITVIYINRLYITKKLKFVTARTKRYGDSPGKSNDTIQE